MLRIELRFSDSQSADFPLVDITLNILPWQESNLYFWIQSPRSYQLDDTAQKFKVKIGIFTVPNSFTTNTHTLTSAAKIEFAFFD